MSTHGKTCSVPPSAPALRCYNPDHRETAGDAGTTPHTTSCRVGGEMTRQGWLRQHGLWVGFVAVLMPLLVILGLQYRSLVALEKTSVAAHRGALRDYLEAGAADPGGLFRPTAAPAVSLLCAAGGPP